VVARRQHGGQGDVAASRRERLVGAGDARARRVPGEHGLDDSGDAFALIQTLDVVQAEVDPGLGDTWSDRVTLSPARFTGGGDLAVNASGDVVAVFDRGLGPGRIVQAATRRAGQAAWQDIGDVSEQIDSGAPAVAIDGAGDELAIWSREGNNGNDVVAAAFRPVGSAAWSAPVDVGGPYDNVGDIRVAFDAAGNAVALWRGFTGLWSSYRSFGGSWQAAVQVGTTGQRGYDLALTVADGRDAVAGWTDAGVVHSAIRPGSSGRWRSVVLSTGSRNASGIALAGDHPGDVVAVWTVGSPPNDVVRAALRPAGTASWTQPVDLGAGSLSAAALSGHGDGLAVWFNGTALDESDLRSGGPILLGVAVPSRGTAGKRLRFRVHPAGWGAPLVGKATWDFGDGSSRRGNAVNHAYRKPGLYTVTVTQRDATGRDSTADATIRIGRR
jgi:hypothetical protein